jgi:hypothetical protein
MLTLGKIIFRIVVDFGVYPHSAVVCTACKSRNIISNYLRLYELWCCELSIVFLLLIEKDSKNNVYSQLQFVTSLAAASHKCGAATAITAFERNGFLE